MKKTTIVLILVCLIGNLYGQIHVTVPLPSPCASIDIRDEPVKSKSLEVSIFPNPGRGDFILHLITGNQSEKFYINIYSPVGIKVFSEAIYCSGNGCVKQIAGLNLSNGIYYVIVTAGNVRETKKLIVQQ